MNKWLYQDALRVLMAAFAQNQGFFVMRAPRIHERLHHLVRRGCHHLRNNEPLQAQSLLHDELFRLFGVHVSVPLNRQLSLLAGIIRHVLVSYIRLQRQSTIKGGVEFLIDELRRKTPPAERGLSIDVLEIDAALDQLQAHFPAGSNLLELRYFARLALPYLVLETATPVTEVQRDMRFAKAWLIHYLQSRI